MARKARPKRKNTTLETKFLYYWRVLGGPELERDKTGWTERKLELDFWHPESRVAIEINGGIGRKSGHTSWDGIHRDYEKLILATQAGIRLVFLGTGHLSPQKAPDIISSIIRLTDLE